MERNDSMGGLRDRRSGGVWDAGEEVENYLVSGNEGGRGGGEASGGWLDARSAEISGRDAVRVVGPGSVAAATADEVIVRRIASVDDAGGRRGSAGDMRSGSGTSA